jgi:hypothetical protein
LAHASSPHKSKTCGIIDGDRIEWRVADGEVATASHCKFKGNVYSTFQATDAECKKVCYEDRDCNHFNWIQGVCHLKYETVSAEEADFVAGDGHICGMVAANVDEVKAMYLDPR